MTKEELNGSYIEFDFLSSPDPWPYLDLSGWDPSFKTDMLGMFKDVDTYPEHDVYFADMEEEPPICEDPLCNED